MFEFNSTIEDINGDVNGIAKDLILSNLDIRVIFYNKYKLLLELEPVKNSKFYKITNISDKACYSNNRYIISLTYFENTLDYKMERTAILNILNKSYKKVAEKYKQLINTTTTPLEIGNNISTYQDGIFEVIYLYGYDREKTNGNVTVFIRIKEEVDLVTINNFGCTNEFYDILNNITNKGVFDFFYYYENIINKIVKRDFHPQFLEFLNSSYIKLYKDVNNYNKFYILFNYKKLYSYMRDADDSLDTIIKYMLGFNNGVTKITDFIHFSKINDGKKSIVKNSTHTLEVVLTYKIENIPDYVLNTVRFSDSDTLDIGMYEVTVI